MKIFIFQTRRMQQNPRIRATRRRGRISYFDPDHEEKKNIEVASFFVSQDGEQEMEQLQPSPGPVLPVAAVPANCSGNTAEMFPPQLVPDQMTQRSWETQKDSFCLSFTDPVQRRETGK